MYLEQQYNRMMDALIKDHEESSSIDHRSNNHNDDDNNHKNRHVSTLLSDNSFFPVNTHGGLLCYGAPWEVPAMYNIVEAVQQLQGRAAGRQIRDCRRAVVYGNGGILSASAVAVLSQSL